MIALILAPVKGDAAYPPLAICALKAWLSMHRINACAIDLNKNLAIKNPELTSKIRYYFGQPKSYLNCLDLDMLYNIDTIYNLQLLLKFLYPDKYTDYELGVAAESFHGELNKQLDTDVDILLKSGFRYFGFSTFVSNFCYSILLAQKLKNRNPSIIVFFGGCSTAYAPIREFLIKSNIVDFVLVGEGENSILKLCRDLKNNLANYTTLYSDNIAPRDLIENEISVPIIKDMDELPFPDFSDLNLDNYTPKDKKSYRVLSIATSRGCPNRCAYCSETQYWKRFRQRTVVRVIEEIRHAVDIYRTKIFFFCDSLINGDVLWLKDFCHQLIDNKLNIQWISYATLTGLNGDLLKLMRDSGCISLTLGIEHTSQNILRNENKTSSIGDPKITLLECVNSGILPLANIIYAFPDEQPEDFLNLLYFITDPELFEKVRFTFRPYEIRVGSSIARKLIKASDRFVNFDMKDFQFDDEIQDSVEKLSLYWLPDNDYINETRQKFNVLRNIMIRQDNNDLLNISNVRNFNFPSVLKKLIVSDSCPSLSGVVDTNLSGFQNYLLTFINSKNTVEYITQQTIKYVIESQPECKKDNIYNTCYDYVKKNLIKLSIKRIITWN